MSCKVCLRDIPIAARGLCRACYTRWHRRGTTDYAPKRIRGVCSIRACGRPHAARGFCDLHHQRALETGDPNKTKRPDCWGAKTKHPLYHTWANLQRHRAQHPIVEEWTDFLQFVTDVGSRPEPKAKLFAADETKPIGPDNFVWKRSFIERVPGEDAATYHARRQRAYRYVRNEEFQSYDLKRHYGMSAEEYHLMLERQDHRCAICGNEEKSVIRGRKIRLSVDHCHTTGKIRGMLCSACNRALGGFQDDPEILKRAIKYLRRPPVSV